MTNHKILALKLILKNTGVCDISENGNSGCPFFPLNAKNEVNTDIINITTIQRDIQRFRARKQMCN